MVFDGTGALYGTALEGGSLGNGVIYKLSPPTAQGGTWTESVLYTFQGEGVGDGYYPVGTPAFDSTGAIYGVTESGGIESCGGNDTGCGVAYKLSPPYLKVENGQSKCCTLSPAAATVNLSPGIVVGTTVYGTTWWAVLDPVSLTREAMAAARVSDHAAIINPSGPHHHNAKRPR